MIQDVKLTIFPRSSNFAAIARPMPEVFQCRHGTGKIKCELNSSIPLAPPVTRTVLPLGVNGLANETNGTLGACIDNLCNAKLYPGCTITGCIFTRTRIHHAHARDRQAEGGCARAAAAYD